MYHSKTMFVRGLVYRVWLASSIGGITGVGRQCSILFILPFVVFILSAAVLTRLAKGEAVIHGAFRHNFHVKL